MKFAIVIFITLLCAACSPPPEPVQQTKVESVKINQFYPRDTAITEGDKTVLCYGVENAKSVRIDPPVDGVSPSPTRCVEVSPKRTTHYTLIAESSDGRSVSQSADVQVGADTSSLPKITSFAASGCTKDYQGEAVFTVTFAAQNANEISIDPPAFPTLHGTLFGKFGVKPGKAATYTLIAQGKNGHVAKQKLALDPGTCK
jgi:hypothetical protein